MRARFSASRSAAVAALSLYVSGCGGASPPDPKPAPPPEQAVIATGNGELVSATLGPKGGRLNLAGDGPSIEIPVDGARKDGISISMRKDEPFTPPSGSRLGDSFRVTLALDPPSGGTFAVHSASMTALPAGCTKSNIELAVERPNSVGPSDGLGDSALEWEYVPATFESSIINAHTGWHATSNVPRFWPHRLQFLCGRRSDLLAR
jgi:hypothetical protein